MNEIVRVPFHGSEILTAEVGGKPHIVLKPALESIGLDYSGQLQRLRRRSWATMGEVTTVAADGKARSMATADVRTFLMLLATVNERQVADDVRPLLVAYQLEMAATIEAYWTQGGAINPRATDDQLAAIIGRAEGQARVLRTLGGIVDPHWLEAKARHVAARALGEEPELNPDDRPLTVGEYLEDRGLSADKRRSIASQFGKRLKALYKAEYNEDPPSVERFVDGALRKVAGYTERHRPLFDLAWNAYAVLGR